MVFLTVAIDVLCAVHRETLPLADRSSTVLPGVKLPASADKGRPRREPIEHLRCSQDDVHNSVDLSCCDC